MSASRISPRSAAAGVLVLTAVAIAVAAAASARSPESAARSEEFQRVVGGLGWGASIDLSACPRAFDPRLGLSCPDDVGPLAGGLRFCLHFGGSGQAPR